VEKKAGQVISRSINQPESQKKTYLKKHQTARKCKKVYSIVRAFYYGMGINGMGINVTTKKKEKQRENMLNIAGKGVY
jgi:hypothetical protein